MTTDTVVLRRQKRKPFRRSEQWRWTYISSNGNVLARSSEGYANFSDAMTALATVLGVDPEVILRSDRYGEVGVGFYRYGHPITVRLEQ